MASTGGSIGIRTSIETVVSIGLDISILDFVEVGTITGLVELLTRVAVIGME